MRQMLSQVEMIVNSQGIKKIKLCANRRLHEPRPAPPVCVWLVYTCRAEHRTEVGLYENAQDGHTRTMSLADLPVDVLERLCTFLAADDVCRFKAYSSLLLLH